MTISAGEIITAKFLTDLATEGTYTPVLGSSSAPAPNLGADGSITGTWHRNGREINGTVMIHFAGTGADAGSGFYEVSLPFDADLSVMSASTNTGAGSALGGVVLRDDSGVNSSLGVAHLRSASLFRIVVNSTVAGNTLVGFNTPWTWAAGDRIAIEFTYTADPAGLP